MDRLETEHSLKKYDCLLYEYQIIEKRSFKKLKKNFYGFFLCRNRIFFQPVVVIGGPKDPTQTLQLNFSKRNSFVTLFCMLKLISFILHVSSKFFTSIFKINILFSKLGYETNFSLKLYYFESTTP